MLVSWVFSRISCYIFRTNLGHAGPVIVVQLWDWLPVGITWLHTLVQEMGASQAAVGSDESKQRCKNRGAPLARGPLRREHWVGREKQVRLRQGSKIKRREPLGPPDHLPLPFLCSLAGVGPASFVHSIFLCCLQMLCSSLPSGPYLVSGRVLPERFPHHWGCRLQHLNSRLRRL